MFRHTLVLSLRTLWKNKFHAILNIVGLAIGITACLVIYLIVTFELSFNRQIPDNERIYRIHSKFTGSFSGLNRGAPTATAPYIKDNFKGVEHVTMFFVFGSNVAIPRPAGKVKIDGRQKAIIASTDYFKVFDAYEFIAGGEDVLARPNQVILTESQAKKYFGENASVAIGQEVVYRDSLVTTVGAIVRDLPFRSDLEFTEFISMPTVEASWLKRNYRFDDWASTNSSTQIFVKSLPGVEAEELRSQLPQLSKIYKEKSNWDATNAFNVQPLLDLHFDAETGIFDFSRSVAHLPTLLLLSGVGALLLIIAAINFINLATAQAVNRAKEVGVRKVLGSSRYRLVIQFVAEGLVLTFFAVVLALPLTEFSLSFFTEFVPSGVSLNLREFIPFLLVIIVVIGILASAYPAFVLSSFLPALALKKQIQNSNQSRSAYMRKALIVFQFTIAQVLIIGTLMVGWQIRFLLNKDLGFRKDAIVYFDTPWWDKQNRTPQLYRELQMLPEISAISLSDQPPAYNGWSSSMVKFKNSREEVSVNAYRKFGDVRYLNFYGMELIAGKNLTESDTVKEMIINETLLKKLGLTSADQAIGQVIDYSGKQVPVVGVVKDFHFQSLHQMVEPVMIANEMDNFRCLNLKLATASGGGEQFKDAIKKVEASWKKIYPDAPFNYEFLDETIKSFYQSEQRTSKLAQTATALAIFISCLGLFGLASFTTSQRTKEIGIRKVFGASIQQILFLLSKDFLILVAVAFVIASPLAWTLVREWLSEFSYRADINYWLFASTAVVAVVVAFVTVSYQTFVAAKKNPADSLKSE